jgi:tetratricopeptide (TPR) repeat protein
MTALPIEDTHHLKAAKGWVELGNHLEAFDELEKIAPLNRAHPDVLGVRWQIYTLAKKHDAALTIAETLVKMTPREYEAHIWRAHSLHELGQTKEAIDFLTAAAGCFPGRGIIGFHLACYYAALGELGEARDWLKLAFETPEANALKLKALDDPRLKGLWEQIGRL